MARQHAKALRIGIIQKGKIIEERLLKQREPVTIGSGPKNTFSIPQSDLPETFTLFTVERGELSLAFDDRMDGRIHAPSGAADFGALAAEGLAKRRGAIHVLPLRDDQWGKVLVGEVTVLFQFVTPPPEPPRPTLPQVARGNHFRSMDRLFVLVLLASLGVHVSAYAGLSAQPVREEVTLEEIPDRFAKLLIPERKPADDAAKEAVRKAARSAAVAKAVQSKGLLRALGALGPGTGSGAVADVFGKGAGFGDVAAALSSAGGVAVATDPGTIAGRKGGEQGGPAQIGDLGTSGA